MAACADARSCQGRAGVVPASPFLRLLSVYRPGRCAVGSRAPSIRGGAIQRAALLCQAKIPTRKARTCHSSPTVLRAAQARPGLGMVAYGWSPASCRWRSTGGYGRRIISFSGGRPPMPSRASGIVALVLGIVMMVLIAPSRSSRRWLWFDVERGGTCQAVERWETAQRASL